MQANQYPEIAAKIQRAKKYQHLSPETISRVVDWAASRYTKKEVEKQAKKKLHQVFGAYFHAGEKAALEKSLEKYDFQGADEGKRKDFFREIMRLHASSRERIEILPDYYQRIFELADRPDRLIDLACGLNPFSWPWLHDAAPSLPYQGFDIDQHSAKRMLAFFQKIQLPVEVHFNDLFINIPPHQPADTLMLLKTLPCLEQQEKGISAHILSKINAHQVIVSFPSKSLGGKEKGMIATYQSFLKGLLENVAYDVKGEIQFENESVYVLGKT